MAGRVLIGTSGYVYRDWRGILYPPGLAAARWLARYAESFATLELNATFYRLPTPGSAERWAAATPDGFVFAAKGSRFLTHMKRLTDADLGLERYYERVRGLGGKLGVVLWQLPPNWAKADPGRLDAFLEAQPKGPRQVFEFRHENWYSEEVCRVLDRRGAAFCEHDLVPEPRPPRLTGGFRYFRFHGVAGKYHGRYGPSGVRRCARELARWRDRGLDAYVYFNNDHDGAALYDARELSRQLDQPLDLALPRLKKA